MVAQMTKKVLFTIGVLALSMLLWIYFFGDVTRNYLMSVFEPAYNQLWLDATMNDGSKKDAKLTEIFDKAKDIPN